MPERPGRINITLAPIYAGKLAEMARRMHVTESSLARALLSQALDQADLDPHHVGDLLDGLPGALERAHQGLENAKAERTINLDDL